MSVSIHGCVFVWAISTCRRQQSTGAGCAVGALVGASAGGGAVCSYRQECLSPPIGLTACHCRNGLALDLIKHCMAEFKGKFDVVDCAGSALKLISFMGVR